MLQIQNLVGGYSKTPILKGIDLTVQKGEFFALLGPNGSGKTTLFKLITGQLPIQEGKVLLSGKPLKSYSKLEKAKKIAVLSQEVSVSFDFTVEEIVRLGRYPHQKGLFKNLSKKDFQIIDEVMELTKVTDFAKKQFRTLSGGEKQRVLLAKALAQEPELLLLDEPTNHLDIKHTFQLLDLLKERQQKMGLTIFAILHDLNVASLFADRFALLQKGSIVDLGDVDLLRKEEQLQQVYKVQVNAQSHPTVPKPQLLMTPNYSSINKSLPFEESFNIQQTEKCVHIEYTQPLRTMSNAHYGDGIQWNKHFCQFYVPNDERCSENDLQKLMENYEISTEQVAGFMNNGNLLELVIQSDKIDNIEMMVVVSIVNNHEKEFSFEKNKNFIQVMLFIDCHFTDGELVNSYMAATEATANALKDFAGIDCHYQTDRILLAVTQDGNKKESTQEKQSMGHAIRQLIYCATKEAIQNQSSNEKLQLQTV